MTTGADILDKAAATWRERNAVYKDNFVRLGKMMAALFPDGLTIKTSDDWTRLYFFFVTCVKWSRYATSWKEGHADSSLDASVYAAMLHAFDKDIKDGYGIHSGYRDNRVDLQSFTKADSSGRSD